MATAAQHVFSSGRRALVVDDSQIARFVLRDLLEREGFDVATADSAEAAFDRLDESCPDVVFMDHMLPGMQGLDAVRRMRLDTAYRHVPVVMYTSQESDAFARMARAAGADDVYLKTADTAGLLAVLARLGLMNPESVDRTADGKVVPLRDRRETDEARTHADAAAIVDDLLPVLEQHRARLRQDLLAEFAILERHEERMRRELAAHVEIMTRRAARSVADAVEQEAARRKTRRRDAGRRWLAAAAFIAAVGFGLALGLTLGAPGDGVAVASHTYPVVAD